jgi:hypothetical protein
MVNSAYFSVGLPHPQTFLIIKRTLGTLYVCLLTIGTVIWYMRNYHEQL